MRIFKSLFLIPLLATALTAHASDQLLNSLQPRGPVNDFANVISSAEENQLRAILTELEQKTGDAVVVVTLPSLDGGQIDDFANRLFERWGIGQKGKDDGVLLLGATQERRGNRLRIEVGYGLEGVINDAAAGRILDTYVIPAWNQRQYGSAIASGAAAIAQRVATDKGVRLSGAPQYSRSTQPQRKSNPIMTFLFIIGFIYMAIRHPRLLLLMILMSGRGGRGGGGFGGGGFGGFGGGMSGGGGASR